MKPTTSSISDQLNHIVQHWIPLGEQMWSAISKLEGGKES